ncbi:cache domain-containing protein [Desulfonatronum thiodismutans]|uniref:cache domain-containing protein n=1 Tax=Desulfonatronum thiodismutans TaxID=159290 RepID=UPI00068A5757|nr:cache domain-containing protein [Desulfonatronum thiodismutans]
MLNKLLNLSIPAKTFGLILALVLFFWGTIMFYFVPLIQERLLYGRREALMHVAHSVHSLLDEYVQRVRDGELTLEDAQERAKQRIRHIRYGRDGYFWIRSDDALDLRLIMHPFITELEDALPDNPMYYCVTRIQYGINGPIQYFAHEKNITWAIVEVVTKTGDGFVSYNWPRPHSEGMDEEGWHLKESYALLFEPWGWILGTGLYIDDIQAEMRVLRTEVISFSLIILLLILPATLLASVVFTRSLGILADYADKVSAGDLNARVTGRFYGEARRLMQAITEMVTSLKSALTHAENSRLDAQRLAEAAELASERLAVTLRSIGDGVIAADTEGQVLFLNKAAEELTGWSQSEAQGRLLPEVLQVRDDRFGEVEDMVRGVLANGIVRQLGDTGHLVSRDGKQRIITSNAAPIRDRESRVIGVVLAFRDETEKQRLQDEALKAEKLESLGVLAGGIAHDFNNTLTAILGNITSARLSLAEPDKAERKLREAENATYRGKGLTQQMLTFAKGGTPIRKILPLGELARESSEFALRGTNAKCVFELPDDLWPVHADPDQISRVIHNLALNAHHAMPQGGLVTVTGANIDAPKLPEAIHDAGPFTRISVTDQGHGISPEHLTKIFDPYFTTKARGSGLGLASSYSIIKRHGGVITVESVPGQSTTFHVFLPAVPTASPTPRAAEKDDPDRPGGRILVMDDDVMILDISMDLMEHLGHTAVSVQDGEEAVARYKQAMLEGLPFDAVIMDLTIPGGMGGKEAVREILKLDPAAKIVASSGYSSDPVMANFQEYGFVDSIAKPYTIQEIRKLLNKLLAQAGS